MTEPVPQPGAAATAAPAHAGEPERRLVLAAGIAGTAMLGVVDWISGHELNFFLFYFITVGATAWWHGRPAAIGVAGWSAVVWAAADVLSNHQYSSPLFGVWNALVRLVAFLVIALTISRIRSLLTESRQLSDKLQVSLQHVRTLRGLLPICASCRKVRDDQGYPGPFMKLTHPTGARGRWLRWTPSGILDVGHGYASGSLRRPPCPRPRSPRRIQSADEPCQRRSVSAASYGEFRLMTAPPS